MIPAGSPKRTGPDQETSWALYARAGGRCEICNTDLTTGHAYSKHHRIPRGRGGTNVLSNLMLLCGTGTSGCHGMVESRRTIAYDNGWLVRTGHDPAEQLVRIHAVRLLNAGFFAPSGRPRVRVLLDDDGHYLQAAA